MHIFPNSRFLFLCSLATALPFLIAAQGQAQEKGIALDVLRARPITTAGGKVGELLRQWWKEGTAAGNVGDFYDNRDGAHSDLNTKPYPQLQRFEYSPEQIKARLHWAAARVLRPGVVFGNSSTSAPAHLGGSNPRMYYASPAGLDFLYKQYVGNNLYIYPEHRDHDPGHNGPDDGFGDLYPANTPYLMISQGSSGTDQPFMRAVPFTLAAFRPQVKAKLIETGLLMPTVQMILRATSKALKTPDDYLTGKAHPTVFEGANVDDLAMIRMAHGIPLDSLPPMVQLRVLKEDSAVEGRDFFEPGAREQWADTPCVISRIWRGKEGRRTLLVSAEKSFDVNGKPLKHHWVVLRGDAKRVRITPKNEAGSIAEIALEYPERMPIAPGSPMESNRVDIGVFVHNGVYFSAPGFVTFFGLDSEARTYDEKGRIQEIGYGVQETRLVVHDWPAFFAFLKESSERRKLLSAELLRKEDADILANIEAQYAKAQPEKLRLEAAVKKLEAAGKKDDPALLDARKLLQKTNQELRNLIAQPAKGASRSASAITRDLFRRLSTSLAGEEMTLLAKLKIDPAMLKRVQAERRRLVGFGLATEGKDFTLTPLRKGMPGERALTKYEQALLDRYRGVLLAEGVFGDFLRADFHANLVDQRIRTPHEWRDLYRYDERGNYLGWARWDGGGVKHFNRDGHLILKKDKQDRPIEAESVRYVVKGMRFGPPTASLQVVPTGEIFTYEYRDADDVTGTVKSRERK